MTMATTTSVEFGGSSMHTMARGLLAGAALLAVLAVSDGWAAGPFETPGFTKVFTCAVCHGPAGNSESDSMPIIAGMAPAYFKKQMQAYAGGQRPSAEMEPYAKMVMHLGVDDVAAYFAAQKMRPARVPVDPAAVERGRRASEACVVCHGREGKADVDKGIPALAGQPAGYLREQLTLFKAEKRNPKDALIKSTKAMLGTIPEATLADLAAYYSSRR
ncbi:MAG: c-type cytochrome [Candidatus Rokubacteria bacterium]|nr:c-type cytochrome [Candidatus Rokubacteria bacterium]